MMVRLALVAAMAGVVRAGIISTSQLRMCEKREDGGNVDVTCEEKMVRANAPTIHEPTWPAPSIVAPLLCAAG